MKKSAQFEELMAELLKSRPDLPKIKQTARRLGLSGEGALMDVMAEVLEKSQTKMTPTKKTNPRRKVAEVEL